MAIIWITKKRTFITIAAIVSAVVLLLLGMGVTFWLEDQTESRRNAVQTTVTLLLFAGALASAVFAAIATSVARSHERLVRRQLDAVLRPFMFAAAPGGVPNPGRKSTVTVTNHGAVPALITSLSGTIYGDDDDELNIGLSESDPVYATGHVTGEVPPGRSVDLDIRIKNNPDGQNIHSRIMHSSGAIFKLVWLYTWDHGKQDGFVELEMRRLS